MEQMEAKLRELQLSAGTFAIAAANGMAAPTEDLQAQERFATAAHIFDRRLEAVDEFLRSLNAHEVTRAEPSSGAEYLRGFEAGMQLAVELTRTGSERL